MPSAAAAAAVASDGCAADKFDPDFLYYIRRIRPNGGSHAHAHEHEHEHAPDGAIPVPVARRERAAANSDGECVSDPSPGGASAGDRVSPVEAPSWVDSLVDVDEDYRVFLQHISVVNDRLKLEIGGVVVNYEQEPDDAQSGGSSGVEEEGTVVGTEAAVVSPANEENGVDSDEPMVISEPVACDWRADPTPEKTMEGQESMKRDDSGTRVAPSHRSQGVIWPTHINHRLESDFKRRLLDALDKPFSRREYIKLFDMASIRTPLVKLRQVRNDAKFYPTEEMGNSYFDHYPDLVKQVLDTSYSNGLALMRGFFFWLQNSAHEDQFMPWIDDSKDKEVIPLTD